MALALQYVVPDDLRPDFANPRGLLVSGDLTERINQGRWTKLICLGDVVTGYCMGSARPPDVVVVDLRTRRKELEMRLDEAVRRFEALGYAVVLTSNPPGGLSAEAAETLCEAIRSGDRKAVIVSGEEDMLTLAALQCAPAGSLVVYGIPMKGAAMVVVDNALSREAQTRLLRLKSAPVRT